MMVWPAQSPDANIIENIWDDIFQAVQRDRRTSRQTLIASVFRAWGLITRQRVEQLYDSLTMRVTSIIRAQGYATKY